MTIELSLPLVMFFAVSAFGFWMSRKIAGPSPLECTATAMAILVPALLYFAALEVYDDAHNEAARPKTAHSADSPRSNALTAVAEATS
jgi:hypothetical protein